MQFLVEGADKSLSIIYKKSIIVEKIDAPLAIGDHIKFLWPENAKIQKEFSGTIIAKSGKCTRVFIHFCMIVIQIEKRDVTITL